MNYTQKELDYINRIKEKGLYLNKDYEKLTIKSVVEVICDKGHISIAPLSNIVRWNNCHRCNSLKNYYHIVQVLESYGYTINQDEKEWKNNDSYVKYICEKGHQQETNIRNIRKKLKCGRCYTLKTFYKIRDELESKGFKFITTEDEYIDKNTKILYLCNKGHKEDTLIEYISRRKRCASCSISGVSEKLITPIENVLAYFIENNYEVIDGKSNYCGVRSVFTLRCPHGHLYETTYNSFKYGSRCGACHKINDNRRLSSKEVLKMFHGNGYLILDEEFKYENSKTRVDVKCPNGHEYSTTISNFRVGYRCKICAFKNFSGKYHPNWKGGITPLHNKLRTYIAPWKWDSFNYGDNKCYITGHSNKKKLVVHHVKNFSDILLETLYDLDYDIKEVVNEYSEEEIRNIEELCLKKHYEYGLGIVMLDDIHKLFHSIYGKCDNNIEQVLEFKKDYQDGKYNSFINI